MNVPFGAGDLPLLDTASVRALDAELIARGVPGLLLMENAGRSAAEHISRSLSRLSRVSREGTLRVGVLVGPGNNGGDGLVVARHLRLFSPGSDVTVLFLSPPDTLKGDAAVMLGAARAASVRFESAESIASLADFLCAQDCIVDALFGTGLTRPLQGLARSIVTLSNQQSVLRISLDIPSGINADTGAVVGPDGVAFCAHETITFAVSKPGLHTGPGRLHSGTVECAGLGVPLQERKPAARLSVFRPLGARSIAAHKGDAGHVFIVGGSDGMSGAALLSALGAHRAGAGKVTVASRSQETLSRCAIETMSLKLSSDLSECDRTLGSLFARADSVVIGPGLGRDDWAKAVTHWLLSRAEVPVVIDADALGFVTPRRDERKKIPWVLTPHPLEAAKMSGLPHPDRTRAGVINDDRLGYAKQLARHHGAVCVLKGAGTVVSDETEAWVHPYAEPALGIAGSGDVLSGIIAARLAERCEDDRSNVIDRVNQAVHAHGRAGQRVHAQRGSTRGALASEIADAVALEATGEGERKPG